MNLEDIIPSEKSQVQMVTYCVILLHEMFRISKCIKIESKLVFAMAWAEWEIGSDH